MMKLTDVFTVNISAMQEAALKEWEKKRRSDG